MSYLYILHLKCYFVLCHYPRMHRSAASVTLRVSLSQHAFDVKVPARIEKWTEIPYGYCGTFKFILLTCFYFALSFSNEKCHSVEEGMGQGVLRFISHFNLKIRIIRLKVKGSQEDNHSQLQRILDINLRRRHFLFKLGLNSQKSDFILGNPTFTSPFWH